MLTSRDYQGVVFDTFLVIVIIVVIRMGTALPSGGAHCLLLD